MGTCLSFPSHSTSVLGEQHASLACLSLPCSHSVSYSIHQTAWSPCSPLKLSCSVGLQGRRQESSGLAREVAFRYLLLQGLSLSLHGHLFYWFYFSVRTLTNTDFGTQNGCRGTESLDEFPELASGFSRIGSLIEVVGKILMTLWSMVKRTQAVQSMR